MKVLNIVAVMSPESGGLARSVQGFVAGLCQAGVDAWICPLDGTEPWIPGVRKFNRLEGLDVQALAEFDLVHIHGIWNWGLHKVAVMCRKAGVPYVIVPSGMLEPWSLKQKGLKKRIARWLYQDKDLKCAAALHATAESEAEQFRRLGFKNKIIVSPNGVNVPISSATPQSVFCQGSSRRVLAEKSPDCLTRKERESIVSRIEQTENVLIQYPDDPELLSFIKGYWDGDAKTTRAIVDWGHRIIPQSVINGDIGEIQTHKNSIRSILFHTKFRGPLKVLVLERLADILRNAVLYNKGRDGNEVFYNLAHRLRFDPGKGATIKELIARLIVKETPDGNRTWTVEFSNKKELTGMPTTGEAATVEVTHLKSPSTHTILKILYAVNGAPRRALFVSRMHPKKGVLELVESWHRVFHSHPSSPIPHPWLCELVYTVNGPEEKAYEQKVKDRILELGMTYVDAASCRVGRDEDVASTNFLFTGPLDDNAKWSAYARADLFALPTYSENFGIVVAEALWAGVPVITTKGAPWAELEERKCGWWVELAALDNALREACGAAGVRALPEMGKNGRALIEERYTWKAICAKMAEEYGRLELRA